MEISEIVMLDNLNTGKAEEVRYGTRKISERSLISKDGFIGRKILPVNRDYSKWFARIQIVEAILFLVGVFLIGNQVAKIAFFLLLITLRSICGMPYLLSFYIHDIDSERWAINKLRNHKIDDIFKGIGDLVYSKLKTITIPKYAKDFVEKAFIEMNKKAIRFIFINILAVLLYLLVVSAIFLRADAEISTFWILAVLYVVPKVYLHLICVYTTLKSKYLFEYEYRTVRLDDGEFSMQLRLSLNVRYLIEEKIKLSENDYNDGAEVELRPATIAIPLYLR